MLCNDFSFLQCLNAVSHASAMKIVEALYVKLSELAGNYDWTREEKFM